MTKRNEYIYKTIPCNHGLECHPPCSGFLEVRDREAELRRDNRRLRKQLRKLEAQNDHTRTD